MKILSVLVLPLSQEAYTVICKSNYPNSYVDTLNHSLEEFSVLGTLVPTYIFASQN